MTILRFSTYNVRGLRQARKRRKVFAFLHSQNRDIFFIQESHCICSDSVYWKNEWGGRALFSFGSSSSRGVCVLFNPSLDVSIISVKVDTRGRFIIADVGIYGKVYTLVNIYAPNLDCPSFFVSLTEDINSFTRDEVIMGGDFNFVLNINLDKKGGIPRTNFNAREQCLALINLFDLTDIWRERNPHRADFTWSSNITPGIHCRLDFFLISRHLTNLTSNCSSSPGLQSDHSLVNLDINVFSEIRGPGYWKFNNSLLNDDNYKAIITDLLTLNINNRDIGNPAQKWDFIKYQIRSTTIKYSKIKAKERRKLESELLDTIAVQERLYFESSSTQVLNTLKEARNRLSLLYDLKLQGIIVRSRARWVENGEKATKYFLNLEKRNKSSKVIRKLKKENGEYLTNSRDVLEELRHYYRNLYSSERVDSHLFLQNIQNRIKLNLDDAAHCEGLLSAEDCRTALFSLPNGKSPGSDGLSVDFYKFFWPIIGDTVINSLNYAYNTSKLSNEQGRAVITLIPKVGKDPELLKNYRPISLLNTDYKICAKVLATRVKSILHIIISPNQTGFIKNRFIGENIRFVLDLVDYCKMYNRQGLLLLVDFEKAFDRIEWNFIHKCLHFFGFGDNFVNWFKTLYSASSGRVINNGYSCRDFSINRGVRQGCPLSPYLFIICAEILARSVNDNSSIKGIRLFGTEVKLLNYADDTTIFLDGSPGSLREVVDTFHALRAASGLKVNFEKSYLFPLGSLVSNNPLLPNIFNFKWTTGPVTMLGITFTNNRDDLFKLNYTPKLSRLKRLLNLWSQRDLTPIGRITITKTLGLSQLVFLFQVLPDPPLNFIKELESIIFRFIWSGKPDKIKRATMIAPQNLGGLRATHIYSFIRSLKCTWVRRYTDGTNAAWKLFFDFYLSPYGKSFLFNCNFNTSDILVKNSFIKDICTAWSSYAFKTPANNFQQEIIWNNSFIKIDKKVIFYKFMYQKGVMYINDLFDEFNRPFTIEHFKFKYSINVCPFTLLRGIYASIPKTWKDRLNVTDPITFDPKPFAIVHQIPYLSRFIYLSSVKSFVKPPVAIDKWNVSFNFDLSQWNAIFQAPFISLRESKVQYFQFRFIHRILGTNKLLWRMNLRENSLCSFCGIQDETLDHLFWECPVVSNFILDTEQEILGQQFILSKQDFYFGYKTMSKHPYNFLIFHMKNFIYQKKMAEEHLVKKDFLYRFKFLLRVEEKLKSASKKYLSYDELKSSFQHCQLLF